MQQLLCHLFSDYILQSNWMALNKSKRSWPCLIHVCLYTLPFFLLTHSWKALAVIAVTHFIIDRFSLARYVVWIKNHIDPHGFPSWKLCSRTGYFHERDPEEFTVKFSAKLGQHETMIVPPKEYAEKTELIQAYMEAKKTYPPIPMFLAAWLTIITDNSLHLLCNFLALKYL